MSWPIAVTVLVGVKLTTILVEKENTVLVTKPDVSVQVIMTVP